MDTIAQIVIQTQHKEILKMVFKDNYKIERDEMVQKGKENETQRLEPIYTQQDYIDLKKKHEKELETKDKEIQKQKTLRKRSFDHYQALERIVFYGKTKTRKMSANVYYTYTKKLNKRLLELVIKENELTVLKNTEVIRELHDAQRKATMLEHENKKLKIELKKEKKFISDLFVHIEQKERIRALEKITDLSNLKSIMLEKIIIDGDRSSLDRYTRWVHNLKEELKNKKEGDEFIDEETGHILDQAMIIHLEPYIEVGNKALEKHCVLLRLENENKELNDALDFYKKRCREPKQLPKPSNNE
nr:hypothetical protein [Helicobacter pylori]